MRTLGSPAERVSSTVECINIKDTHRNKNMRSSTETCMNRRRALTVVGTVGLTGVAGCLGEEGFEYVAEPAVIPDAESRGYEVDGPEDIEFDETLEMGGVSQDVHIRTWSAAYASSEDEASLYLFSTPDVSIAGISANPLARLSGADLIARVLNEGLGEADADGGIQEIEAEDEFELPVLGDTREVAVFSAVFKIENGELPMESEAASGDGEIPMRLYVLSFDHEDDVILSVGLYPELVEAGGDIQALMEAIEHPT